MFISTFIPLSPFLFRRLTPAAALILFPYTQKKMWILVELNIFEEKYSTFNWNNHVLVESFVWQLEVDISQSANLSDCLYESVSLWFCFTTSHLLGYFRACKSRRVLLGSLWGGKKVLVCFCLLPRVWETRTAQPRQPNLAMQHF